MVMREGCGPVNVGQESRCLLHDCVHIFQREVQGVTMEMEDHVAGKVPDFGVRVSGRVVEEIDDMLHGGFS